MLCWHKWTPWSEMYADYVSGYVNQQYMQKRYCTRCNKCQVRMVPA